jgi:hypothetical protein
MSIAVERFMAFPSIPAHTQRVTLYFFAKAGDRTRTSRYLYQRSNVAIRGNFLVHKADGTTVPLNEGGFIPEFDLSDPKRSFYISSVTDNAVLLQLAEPNTVLYAEFLD